MKKARIILILLLSPVLLLSGCTISRPVIPESGHYYINPGVNFLDVGRVVVFELENNSTYPELSMVLTKAIAKGLEKKHIFSVKTLVKTNPAWRNLDLDKTSSYSLEEFSSIRQLLKADAVLFGSITQYHPYPHMSTGLHLKLIDLHDGRLLWDFEQVWDSTDKRVEQRMKMFFDSQMRAGYEPMNWRLLITSPRAFNKFVVYEVAKTLPEGNHYIRTYGSSEKSGTVRIKSAGIKKTLEIPEKLLKFVY